MIVEVDLSDASLDVLDDVARARMTARSLRQMVRARRPYAMIPTRLSPPPEVLEDLTADVCTAGHLDDDGTLWVCLLAAGHDGPDGWPPPTQRRALADALGEQVDPVARVNRRWAHALAELEPDADPGEAVADFLDDLAGEGMPPA